MTIFIGIKVIIRNVQRAVVLVGLNERFLLHEIRVLLLDLLRYSVSRLLSVLRVRLVVDSIRRTMRDFLLLLDENSVRVSES